MFGSEEPLSFQEIRQLLLSRGYTKAPISLDGLNEKHKQSVIHALRTLFTEREEEVQVRERLLSRNRELEQKLERMQRTMKQGKSESADAESRMHALQSQLQNIQSSLTQEQSAHRVTHDQLTQTRKQMRHIKLAAQQHRAATERRADRFRERVSTIASANLKHLVPDLRIASPAFIAKENTTEGSRIADQQLAEAERRTTALMETTHALKQLAFDALITLREADVRLQKLVDVDAQFHEGRRSLRRSRTSHQGPELADIFPPLRPLVTEDTEETHPAREQLAVLSRALQEHVAELSHNAAVQHAALSRSVDHDEERGDTKRRRLVS